MNSGASEQHELLDDLRTTVRAALARTEPGSGDDATWRTLVEQLGVAGLLVPERHGGLGLGAREAVAVSEEIGAAAARVPFLSHAVSATTLLRASEGDGASGAALPAPQRAQVDQLLADAATGSRRLAVVRTTRDRIVLDTSTAEARLTGAATVVDGPGADVLLVEAPDGEVSAVCAVDRSAAGVTVTERSALDLSRSIGTVVLDAAPATVLLTGTTAAAALAAAQRWSRLAVAADQVGIARRSLAVSVEYAGLRRQFGAVIGSFQAVKHRCTEVLLEVELAAALVDQAASALDAGTDPQDLVSTAHLQATTAALVATDAAIQIHGGTGFTWEHVAHQYFRRARSNASLLGPAQELRDAVAASVGL